MAKKSSGWSNMLNNLLFVIPSIFNIARHFVSCIECEARQAKRGLIALFILALIAITFLIGFWLCICGIIFLWIQTWMSAIAALAMLLLIHLVLLFIVGIWMASAKDKLLFPNTRELFHQ